MTGETPQSNYQNYKLVLVKNKYHDQSLNTYIKLLYWIEFFLHNVVNSVHSTIVQSLILQAKAQIDLNDIQFDKQSEKEKITTLFEAVRSLGKLSSCRKALHDFLEILINFKSSIPIAEAIRKEIAERFSDTFEIEKQQIITVEEQNNSSEGQICTGEEQHNTEGETISLVERHSSGESKKPTSKSEKTKSKQFSLQVCILIMGLLGFTFFIIFLCVRNPQGEHIQYHGESNFFNSTSSAVPSAQKQESTPKVDELNDSELERRLKASGVDTDLSNTSNSNITITDSTAITTSTETAPAIVIHENTTSPAPKSQVNLRRLKSKVKVNSFQDYESFMTIAPIKYEIVAGVFIEDPTKWPCRANLGNAHRVERLYIGGNVYFSCLLHTFSQMNNLTFLLLSNRFGKLCRWNEGLGASFLDGEHDSVYLNKTTTLILEKFYSSTSCVDAYIAVAEKIKTPNLRRFVLKRGVIDDRNIILIQRILKNNWKTLTHLKFQWTHMAASSPFFGSEMAGVLKHVEHVSVDYISDYVSWSFCQALPNLKALTSQEGYLLESQLPQLQDCYSLETLKTSLKLTQSITFDVTAFASKFKNITTIKIKLLHEICEDSKTSNALYLRGLNTLKDNISNFYVASKCRLKIDPESGSLNSLLRQESWSFDGGYFIFSYDLNKESR